MPSKKEKQQQASLALKNQSAALANSTNTTVDSASLINTHAPAPTNLKKTLINTSNSSSTVLDSLVLAQNQKNELDELNNRFSNYVDGLSKKNQENHELQKVLDLEKQKQSLIFSSVEFDRSSMFVRAQFRKCE